MSTPDLAALIAAERLPPAYGALAETFWRPLARLIAARAACRSPLVVGINGAQGSGKSTLCRFLEVMLAQEGLRAATLSLDDLYLTRGQRAALARDVHPLFATRGVPGTHDVELGLAVIGDLLAGRDLALPRFDKARDDRSPRVERIAGPVDVLLLEGWCVGARPQAAADLAAPVNALEATEDRDGIWRGRVNRALGGEYARLFATIDLLVSLRVAGFAAVQDNRRRQEHKLAAACPDAPGLMDEAALGRFIAHYERLTRHQLATMPKQADIVFDIGPDQAPMALPAVLAR